MRRALALLVVAAGLALPAPAHALFEECEAPPTPPTAGEVRCRTMHSAHLGGSTAFSYYLPTACDAAGATCPTLYLLHGFGGDYRSMLGTAAAPSAWVRALASGPPVDPNEVPDPWSYQDPDGWVPEPPLDFILIAPHGRTVPGGFGPAAGLDSFWADWNPRYANGEAYTGPPPRFESHLLGELMPAVEATFNAGSGREWRSLAGVSLGGYGTNKLGLQHPDLWTGLGSVSGAHNFEFVPPLQPGRDAGPGLSPPAGLPYQPLPGLTPHVPWTQLLPSQAQGFAVSFYALGDPAADQAYFRGNMPVDLAMNARGWGHPHEQSLYVREFVHDTVPRRQQDFTFPDYAGAQAFESIVLPMNLEMEAAFRQQDVDTDFEIHPGIHSGPYWNPFIREHLEALYARVRHRGGGGSPPPAPAKGFDYRTISTDFSVWGWGFEVDRDPVEFLTLRKVRCQGLTLQGTGVVTVTVPSACGRGYQGTTSFTVDLGPSYATDEPGGLGALPAYGRTVHVALTPLN